MNIFYVNSDPFEAARCLVDKHVVKMVLETAQLLCTAHRVLDPHLSDRQDMWGLYKSTHMHHPSAVWVRQSAANYDWLFNHFEGLLDEYRHRYSKTHKCMGLFVPLAGFPVNIRREVNFTPPTPAMDRQYLVGNDSLLSYRNYYRLAKRDLHKWTRRLPPEWINEEAVQPR